MTPIEAAMYVDKLSVLRRIPKGKEAHKALIDMFARLAVDGDHAERMVNAMLDAYTEWPGPAAIRQAAQDAHPGRERDQNELLTKQELWEAEYRERTAGWLCPHCNGFGIIHDQSARQVQRCTCPEGDPKWIHPSTGRPCSPDVPGAVHYNSDAWIEKWNQMLQSGRKLPAMAAKAMAAAAERKKAAQAKTLVPMRIECPNCRTEHDVEVSEAGKHLYRCLDCDKPFSFDVRFAS